MQANLEDEVRAFVDRWNQAMINKDVAAAESLREDGYAATFPYGPVVSKKEEMAMIASASHQVEAVTIEGLTVRGRGNKAVAAFESVMDGAYQGERFKIHSRDTLSLRRADGRWRAQSFCKVDAAIRQGAPATRRSLAEKISSGMGRQLRKHGLAASFQQLAFVPYRAGMDFLIPKQPENIALRQGELPMPPKELWLGYYYPIHGQTHVHKMLELVYASGLKLERGNRVLDFGCAAGRMIRHLQDLADTCEIWGTDISAPHIYWCKQHLSPPFHFATTTKVPHLPFEDRSFHFIYCGSVFTHIDDLADAWLLELHRILAPAGRLYVTIHDNRTVELFESGQFDTEKNVAHIKASSTYQQAKHSFGMFTIGRDAQSQVFYDIDYFKKMLLPMFEVVSIAREAYVHQTAVVLKRRQ